MPLKARSTPVRSSLKLRFSNLFHQETLFGLERYSTKRNGSWNMYIYIYIYIYGIRNKNIVFIPKNFMGNAQA